MRELLNYGADMDVFLGQFKELVQSIVVKQIVKAGQNETAEMKRDADKYLAMKDGVMEWSYFGNFHAEVLQAAGISSSIFNDALVNKDIIPYELRSLCMQLERDYIIAKYFERNNYYRMLNGEPDIEEIEAGDFVYLGTNDEGISSDTPIHLLSDGEKEHINNSHILDDLKAKYPDKKWLDHLGSKAISYYKARSANNYDILYMKKTANLNIYVNFSKFYASARDYVMRGLYNNEDRRLYDSYDSFMGLIILTMAINRMLASLFEQGITRDFYDDTLIKTFFECFNLPYEQTIDVKYQRMIAKRLNLLLQVKACNQVLFDITGLFNYNHVNIYKYYLVKDYRKDLNYDPIIEYKTVVDEDGNAVRMIDPDKSYDIYFKKVNVKSDDPFNEISHAENRVEYHSITGEDPYWIDDSNLINKIYNNKFNAILTKYMSIDVMFDISKIMYETCHAFRLIFDRNEETKKIKITIPYVTEPVSLYDVVTFLCALVAKKFSLKGEIPVKANNIATVYGFNFKTDLSYLRNEILEDIEGQYGQYSHIDPDFLKYLRNISLVTIDDVRILYENIHDLRMFIDTAMRYTTDIQAYQAYQKLYHSLLITEDLPEIYTKNDGTYATTFAELLADRRPDLKEVLDGTSAGYFAKDEDGLGEIYDNMTINGKINKVLDSLSNISEELDELRFVNEKSEIVNNITKLINQFKSYTVDYNQSGIIYLLNDPHTCFLKILDSMYHYTSEKSLRDDIKTVLEDVISHFVVFRKHKDKLFIDADSRYIKDAVSIIKQMIKLIHRFHLIIKETTGKDDLYITDVISNVEKEVLLPLVFGKFKDKIADIYKDKFYKDYIHFDSTKIWASHVDILLDDKTSIEFLDTLEYGKEAIMYSMLLSMVEKILIEVKMYLDEPIKLLYKLTMSVIMKNHTITEVIDTLGGIIKDRYTDKDRLKLPDWADIKRMINREDYIHLKHIITDQFKDSNLDALLNILDIMMNENVIFPVDHFLDLSYIEWVRDKYYDLYMNLGMRDGCESYIDRAYESRVSTFDSTDYWNIDLLRKYYLNIDERYIYDSFYNPREDIEFIYSFTKEKNSNLVNNLIIDPMFSSIHKDYPTIHNRFNLSYYLRTPYVDMAKYEYLTLREYLSYTKYEKSDLTINLLDLMDMDSVRVDRSYMNLKDKADIRFIFHPDLYLNLNDSLYINKNLVNNIDRFKLIDTMTYNIPMEYFSRITFTEYHRHDSFYDIRSKLKLLYYLKDKSAYMSKREILNVEMFMQDFISNFKCHDNLTCNAFLYAQSNDISIKHYLNLNNLVEICSEPSYFIENLNIEDLLEHDSITDFSDRLSIQFRHMTDRVEWDLEKHRLNVKNEIDYTKEYKYSYGMEINQNLHSNNSIKVREPVGIRDTLRILYID